MLIANRILYFASIFLISSSLALSPILSSPVFYSQKGPNVESDFTATAIRNGVASPQIVNTGNQPPPSSSFPLPPNQPSTQVVNTGNQPFPSSSLFPNVAYAQSDNSGAQPSTASSSFSLFPNVAYAQSDNSGAQPSASFFLTVTADCSTPGGTATTGDDTIIGTSGTDTISANSGNDNVFGCAGDDTLNGNGGNDFIDGGDGIDTIKGNEDNDVLIGGPGNDDIDGGSGDDTLTGGPGKDNFQCGSGTDTITDYNPNAPDFDTIQAMNQCENINPTPTKPTITQPATVTDCTQNFVVTGTAQAGSTITLYKKVGATLTQLDGTTTTDASGQWSITLNPLDPNLGDGTFTLVAKAQFGQQISVESDPKTLTINCALTQPVINDPGTITDCTTDFTVTGTADPGTTITLYKKVGATLTQLDGTTTTGQNGAWSITLDPTDPNLGQGTFTLVATASKQGKTDVTSDEVTLIINCPPAIDAHGDDTDCTDGITITGTSEPGTESINLYADGTQITGLT
ncbi:MAG: hypothetical protein WAL23_00690, partial [Nitrososphaeraceae archaeon]